MKPLLAGLSVAMLLSSCVDQTPQRQTVVERFYWDAMARAGREHGSLSKINLDGLHVERMSLPGRPLVNDPARGTASAGAVPKASSTILVGAADRSVKDVVEVVVSPAFPAALPAPPAATPEFLEAQRAADLQALQGSRFLSVRRGYLDFHAWTQVPTVTTHTVPAGKLTEPSP